MEIFLVEDSTWRDYLMPFLPFFFAPSYLFSPFLERVFRFYSAGLGASVSRGID